MNATLDRRASKATPRYTGIIRPPAGQGPVSGQRCLDPRPFVEHAERLLEQLKAEYLDEGIAVERFYQLLGWDRLSRASADRRWQRWLHECTRVLLSDIEDALTNTGWNLFDLYPHAARELEQELDAIELETAGMTIFPAHPAGRLGEPSSKERSPGASPRGSKQTHPPKEVCDVQSR